jgi:hypothetical protein
MAPRSSPPRMAAGCGASRRREIQIKGDQDPVEHFWVDTYTCPSASSVKEHRTVPAESGTGVGGFSGDGGPATQAQVRHPCCVTVSDQGEIYFLDPMAGRSCGQLPRRISLEPSVPGRTNLPFYSQLGIFRTVSRRPVYGRRSTPADSRVGNPAQSGSSQPLSRLMSSIDLRQADLGCGTSGTPARGHRNQPRG